MGLYIIKKTKLEFFEFILIEYLYDDEKCKIHDFDWTNRLEINGYANGI
jgi:hypothetical protein